MSNGKPIASDLDVLEAFDAPFVVDGIPRDERCASAWGCHINQVYSLWSRRRFDLLLDSGVSVRSGWLTPEGRRRLAELRGEDLRATENSMAQRLRAGCWACGPQDGSPVRHD